MSFYMSIADYYEEIFPPNKMQIEFVQQAFINTNTLSVLDIGCGIGTLSFELSGLFRKVTAIDLDGAMLNVANSKSHESVSKPLFRQLDMQNIQNEFGSNTFDAVLCFGNTLVHLNGPDEVLNFFKQAKSILKENGKLLFQIINYDRIIDQRINGLPTIENEKIKFVRNYSYHAEQNILDFESILTLKDSGEKIENTIQLYPLRKSEIENLLEKSGFSEWQFYGNFKMDEFMRTSIPLIVKAK